MARNFNLYFHYLGMSEHRHWIASSFWEGVEIFYKIGRKLSPFLYDLHANIRQNDQVFFQIILHTPESYALE